VPLNSLLRAVSWLVDVLGAAVAEGGQHEENSGHDRQQVADHRHPETPAEVRRTHRVAVRVESLTQILAKLGRVIDSVVWIA